MHTLVIIDMQLPFAGSGKESLRRPILREIELSKRNGWPIVLVEYDYADWLGTTQRYILDALSGSDYVTCSKKRDDGSNEVHTELVKLTKSKRVRIVGVNTDCCVKYTALSLHSRFGYTVQVVADSCWSAWDQYSENACHQRGLNIMTKNNIRILRRETA